MQDDGDLLERCLNESQCRQITISLQVPLDWALPLYGYVMPVIVAVTLATNSFIVLVLSHRYLRTPTNYVLLAMAVSELLTGLSCVPWLLYYYTMAGYRTEGEQGLPAFWCSMFPYMAYILPSIFHAIATFLTVYLAVQRYIYICVPKLVRSHCTMRRSKQVITAICIVAFWIYAPDALSTYNQSFTLELRKNVTRRVCTRMQTGLMRMIGNNTYYYLVFGVHTLLVHTLPSVLLVIFTWKLISAIRIADKRHAHLLSKSMRRMLSDLNENSDTVTPADLGDKRLSVNIYRARGSIVETKRVQGLKQNTRMLIAVILLFLLTEIPAAAIFTVHMVSVTTKFTKYINIDGRKYYDVLNILLIIRNVLIVISYPFRFAIYCGMSQQFREVVRQIFLRQAYFWHFITESDSTGGDGARPVSQQNFANSEREPTDERRYRLVVSTSNGGAIASTMVSASDDAGACAACVPCVERAVQCDIVVGRRPQASLGFFSFDPYYDQGNDGDELTGLIGMRPRKQSIADVIASLPSTPTMGRDWVESKRRYNRSTQCGGFDTNGDLDAFILRKKQPRVPGDFLRPALMESSNLCQTPVVLSVIS